MSAGPPDSRWRERTRLIRTAGGPECAASAKPPVGVNPPVQRASTVILPDAAALYDHRRFVTYGRQGLATHTALREALCALEGAGDTFLFPSGAAAVAAGLMSVLKAGDELLLADGAYGPTRRFALGMLARFGVSTRIFAPRATAAEVEAMIGPQTRAVMMESPASLTFEVQDVPAVAAMARRRGLVSLIDNTYGAGLLFKPLAHGVDLSIQSLTKYVGGHADVFMGSVAVAGPAYARALDDLGHDMGWAVSPDDAYLMLRGLRTLPVRLAAHGAGGLEIARWLEGRMEVAQVLHPGLETSPDHALFTRDFPGANGLLGVVLRPASRARVHAFLDALRLFGLGFSWGGFESLAVDCGPQLKRTTGLPKLAGPLIRLHVGLEDVEDLKADLERGFAALSQGAASAEVGER